MLVFPPLIAYLLPVFSSLSFQTLLGYKKHHFQGLPWQSSGWGSKRSHMLPGWRNKKPPTPFPDSFISKLPIKFYKEVLGGKGKGDISLLFLSVLAVDPSFQMPSTPLEPFQSPSSNWEMFLKNLNTKSAGSTFPHILSTYILVTRILPMCFPALRVVATSHSDYFWVICVPFCSNTCLTIFLYCILCSNTYCSFLFQWTVINKPSITYICLV